MDGRSTPCVCRGHHFLSVSSAFGIVSNLPSCQHMGPRPPTLSLGNQDSENGKDEHGLGGGAARRARRAEQGGRSRVVFPSALPAHTSGGGSPRPTSLPVSGGPAHFRIYIEQTSRNKAVSYTEGIAASPENSETLGAGLMLHGCGLGMGSGSRSGAGAPQSRMRLILASRPHGERDPSDASSCCPVTHR